MSKNQCAEIKISDNGVMFLSIVPKQTSQVVDFLAMAVRELPGVEGIFTTDRTSGFGVVVEHNLPNRIVLSTMVLHVAQQIVNNDPPPGI